MRCTTTRNRSPRAAFLLRLVLCMCSVAASWTVLEPAAAHAATVLRSAPRTCCAGKPCACAPHTCPCVKPGPVGGPAAAPEPAQLSSSIPAVDCVRDIVRLPAASAAARLQPLRLHPDAAQSARTGALFDLFGRYLI